MHIDEVTGIVINACIKIHKAIGPGCYEKVYEELLYYELIKIGLTVKRQISLPIEYEGLYIEKAYKLDLLVEDMLVLELKVLNPLPPVAFDQIRTHLSLLGLKHGLLLNFKVSLMKDGIHRVFNNAGNLTL
jgi:GxxExxY protein